MREGFRLLVSAALIAAFLTGCNTWRYNFSPREDFAPREPARTVAASAAESRGPADDESPVWPDESPVSWLELGKPMSMPIGSADAGGAGFKPWRTRRGPAHGNDFWRSFGRDAKELPATMWDDTKATFTNPWVWVGLGLAGASGVAVHKSGADDRVEDHYREHRSQLSKFGDMVGDIGGNPGLHFALAGAMYFTSLGRDDVKGYETSKALINALAINGLTTLALKGVFGTESPNDEPFGWPSGHTSSTFCLATVMHEAYGPWVGVPLYAFATFVGYERIDARNHDLSDVVSGAVIGIAIGYAVMQNHKPKILGFELIPWADPNSGAMGLALSREF